VKIPLSKPDIGEREIALVTDVLKSGQLSLGPKLVEFEKRFAANVGTRFAIATNSGTSALHLGVRALGIGEGDDVLTTSFSFVASVNCLLYERATPVFVDIDPSTLNIDPAKIREIIEHEYFWDCVKQRQVNRQTGHVLKAILPVHVFGLPCDMSAILMIAREFNLRVIEDACEALGAEYCGKQVGTFGDAAVFAFYPNKQMTTAEGGMIVTNDSEVARFCRSTRNQGRDDNSGWLRHERLGFNYRLSELHCAIGLAQLERVGELLAARERVAKVYSRGLANVGGIRLPAESTNAIRSWFVYAIQIQGNAAQLKRDHLITKLRERGIGCQAYFPAIHEQPYLHKLIHAAELYLPCTEAASRSCVALPFFTSMSESEVYDVCEAVREILAEIHEAAPSVQPHYRSAVAGTD
jgi:perosamine synthetase